MANQVTMSLRETSPKKNAEKDAFEAAPTPLGIDELLELVLLEARPLDLLNAKQVNRTWLGKVNTSSNLQRKLGLVPTKHFCSVFESPNGLADASLPQHSVHRISDLSG